MKNQWYGAPPATRRHARLEAIFADVVRWGNRRHGLLLYRYKRPPDFRQRAIPFSIREIFPIRRIVEQISGGTTKSCSSLSCRFLPSPPGSGYPAGCSASC